MKKILLLFILTCTTFSLSAGPIGEARARQIAEEFFAEHSTTRSWEPIELEWAGNAINEPINIGDKLNTSLMYIYNRGENSGFVVVAGDSNVTPIIAYSLDSTINTNDMAEATREILDAWCKQIDAARKEQIPATTHVTTRSGDELLYETALWNQGEPYNLEVPIYDGYRSVTGCVATAMAIVCHYHRWPEYGVGTTAEYSYYDAYDVLRTVPENKLGRKYDYDNMLFDYNNGYNNTEANAVAALMKDMGTSVRMSYHYTASGASSENVVYALANNFSYSKDIMVYSRDNYDTATWNNMMRENVKKYGPTFYAGSSAAGGHAFVVDGYSNDYYHINYGWGGISNGWYMLPYIEYYMRQQALFYLKPDKDGSTKYRDNLQFYPWYTETESWVGLSSDAPEYIVGVPFNISVGGIYNVGASTFNGEVAIVHCNRDGEWQEVLDTFSITELEPSYISLHSKSITLTKSIELGDTIMAYFKGYNAEKWEPILTYRGYTYYKILLCATPEEVAETLIFHYDKEQNVIFLESPNAMQAELYRPTGEVTEVNERAHSYIWYRILEGGEHTLKVHSGGEPYIIKLTF